MESFQWGIKNSGRATSDSFDFHGWAQHSRCSSTDVSRQVNKTETRKEQKNTANVLVNIKNVRRTHWKINKQVTLLILASNCLTKSQSPVHMNTNIETYTCNIQSQWQEHTATQRRISKQRRCRKVCWHTSPGLPFCWSQVNGRWAYWQQCTKHTKSCHDPDIERSTWQGVWREKVKEQVGCVTERLDQRWLRDRSRNKNFVKIVADTRNNGKILIAESEDFIFLYNKKSKTLDHWWMNWGRKAVTKKERGVIGPLNWWPLVNRGQYRDTCNFLEHRLNTVADLVREYMGQL